MDYKLKLESLSFLLHQELFHITNLELLNQSVMQLQITYLMKKL